MKPKIVAQNLDLNLIVGGKREKREPNKFTPGPSQVKAYLSQATVEEKSKKPENPAVKAS